MKSNAILYVPSDTPEAMVLATRSVAGVPLIVRGLLTLHQGGIQRVTLLLAQSQRETIEIFLKRFRKRPLPQIDFLTYDEPYRLSPNLVQKLLEIVDQRFFLINGNLLFDQALLHKMKSLTVRGHELLYTQEGVHPIPFFELTKAALRTLIPFSEREPRSIESGLAELMSTMKHIEVQKPLTANVFLLKRPKDVPVAEKFLAETIRHATPGPIARYFNKRFSLPMSMVLAKLWISPHTITIFNICIGLLSGVFIADGHHYGVILFGATLFQIASIADGCDGEVAKLTFRSSKFGEYIDTISDNLTLLSMMAGLIGGHWRHTHSMVTFVIGGIFLATTILIVVLMARFLRHMNSASLATFDREYLQHLHRFNYPRPLLMFIEWGKYVLKKDVFSAMVFAFALAGVMYEWLYVAALGTTCGAVTLIYLSFFDKRRAAIQASSPAVQRQMAGEKVVS